MILRPTVWPSYFSKILTGEPAPSCRPCSRYRRSRTCGHRLRFRPSLVQTWPRQSQAPILASSAFPPNLHTRPNGSVGLAWIVSQDSKTIFFQSEWFSFPQGWYITFLCQPLLYNLCINNNYIMEFLKMLPNDWFSFPFIFRHTYV